jgi:hypothetical protein
MIEDTIRIACNRVQPPGLPRVLLQIGDTALQEWGIRQELPIVSGSIALPDSAVGSQQDPYAITVVRRKKANGSGASDALCILEEKIRSSRELGKPGWTHRTPFLCIDNRSAPGEQESNEQAARMQ